MVNIINIVNIILNIINTKIFILETNLNNYINIHLLSLSIKMDLATILLAPSQNHPIHLEFNKSLNYPTTKISNNTSKINILNLLLHQYQHKLLPKTTEKDPKISIEP